MTGRRPLLRTMAGLGGGAVGLAACARTLAQRANQIRRAGAGRGWQMQEIRPGLIRGTLVLRDHLAVVDIPYDAQRFSIRYADSRNLLYDGASIHRNYNSWVQNLANDIVAQPPV
ncbi:hypothetical protein GCM10010964_22650 [Caldovatus sediminis]|uniref:Lipoprotein n=1 Tax=Caldovatus sediminis TaxID=2041189 RepID=A0A8J2ZBG0_9PROT|nr:hypothetical protein [Caldovatus sediminis]GGG34166.1 hypothetical protein GCM10010964_22650 [Caldovatus sediminis]